MAALSLLLLVAPSAALAVALAWRRRSVRFDLEEDAAAVGFWRGSLRCPS